MDSTPLDYVLTIPAIWSERAKELTVRCAKKALREPDDIKLVAEPNIRLVAEPEAAAIYALDSISRTRPLRQGDNYIIVDAGGGTVDLISYRVKSKGDERLQLEESARGTGGLCGSIFLNHGFEKYLAKTLGQYYHRRTSNGRYEKKIQDVGFSLDSWHLRDRRMTSYRCSASLMKM